MVLELGQERVQGWALEVCLGGGLWSWGWSLASCWSWSWVRTVSLVRTGAGPGVGPAVGPGVGSRVFLECALQLGSGVGRDVGPAVGSTSWTGRCWSSSVETPCDGTACLASSHYKRSARAGGTSGVTCCGGSHSWLVQQCWKNQPVGQEVVGGVAMETLGLVVRCWSCGAGVGP